MISRQGQLAKQEDEGSDQTEVLSKGFRVREDIKLLKSTVSAYIHLDLEPAGECG